jgi:hypothetical protein
MKLTRENALIHAKPTGDMTPFVGNVAVYRISPLGPEVEVWNPNDHLLPNCLIIHADMDTVTIAILHGGLSGTVKVRLVEAVFAGHELYAYNNGTLIGFADRMEESFSGTHPICALALENGVKDEQIEAVLFRPEAFTVV